LYKKKIILPISNVLKSNWYKWYILNMRKRD